MVGDYQEETIGIRNCRMMEMHNDKSTAVFEEVMVRIRSDEPHRNKNQNNSCTVMVLLCFVVLCPCSAQYCLRGRPLNSAYHSARKAVQLLVCSYTWSIKLCPLS